MSKFDKKDFNQAVIMEHHHGRSNTEYQIFHSIYLPIMTALSECVEADFIENSFFKMITREIRDLTQRSKEPFVENHTIYTYIEKLYDIKDERHI